MTKTNYSLVAKQLSALTEGIPYEVANLANASALLWQEMPDINWVGFYKMTNDRLVLGPFQGKPACIEIPVGRGVCGTANFSGNIPSDITAVFRYKFSCFVAKVTYYVIYTVL